MVDHVSSGFGTQFNHYYSQHSIAAYQTNFSNYMQNAVDGMSVKNQKEAIEKEKKQYNQQRILEENEQTSRALELSAQQIKELSDKYNVSNMSVTDRNNMLQEMADLGIISKETAGCLKNGLIPLGDVDMNDPHVRFNKCTPDYIQYSDLLKRAGVFNDNGDQNWIEYFKAMYEVEKLGVGINSGNSEFFNDLANYLEIMEQMEQSVA